MYANRRIVFGGLIIVLLFIVLVVFYPREQPSTDQVFSGVVEIGVISPTDEDFTKYRYFVELAQRDLNQICNESNLGLSFEFSLHSANRMGAKALEMVQYLHDSGVDLIVGGGWSSQLWVMRDYVNIHEVLVVSPSSTNPQEPMLQDDFIFRLCTHDFMNGRVAARMAESYGVSSMLILERGDAWADGIDDWFTSEYNGTVVARLRYPAEYSEFYDYLEEAEATIGGVLSDVSADDVGVLLLAFSESNNILEELDEYPLLSSVLWFGTNAVANSLEISSEAGVAASKVGLISPQLVPIWSDNALEIAEEYQSLFDDDFDFYDASIYDSCMVLGLSVLEAESVNAVEVREVFPQVAEDYVGLTGPCGLDGNGDRLCFQMGLYGIENESNPNWELMGYYRSPEDEVVLGRIE